MKFYGPVGYVETVETSPGIWEEQVTEITYYGDVNRNTKRNQYNQDSTNNDILITNDVSIIGDAYAYQHFLFMKYVIVGGYKWNVLSVDVQRPRITITIGGLYNEDET